LRCVGVRRAILRPLSDLNAAAERWRDGELSAHTDLKHGRSECGWFDMARTSPDNEPVLVQLRQANALRPLSKSRLARMNCRVFCMVVSLRQMSIIPTRILVIEYDAA